MKHAKRKDYSEAMAQIEAAMMDDGVAFEENQDNAASETDISRGMKRKLSVDSTSSETKKKYKSTAKPNKPELEISPSGNLIV